MDSQKKEETELGERQGKSLTRTAVVKDSGSTIKSLNRNDFGFVFLRGSFEKVNLGLADHFVSYTILAQFIAR